MKSHTSLVLIVGILWMLCGCEKKQEATKSTPVKALVGDITESILSEIRYKRITDRAGSTVQGGVKPPHEILELDALHYKPLASHWVGIKSLDPIPGKGSDGFFRYTLTAELYPDEETSKRRDDEFDATFRKHLENDGNHGTTLSKKYNPVLHFSYERVFYLLATDVSDASDPNEVGKLKFALIKHLTSE